MIEKQFCFKLNYLLSWLQQIWIVFADITENKPGKDTQGVAAWDLS